MFPPPYPSSGAAQAQGQNGAVMGGQINNNHIILNNHNHAAQGQVLTTQDGSKIMWKNPPQAIPKDLKEHLEHRLEMNKIQILEIEATLEELKKLNFKAGDVAFHKEYGNILIRNIKIGDSYSGMTHESLHNKIVADIVTTTGGGCVLASELLPLTDATKILYQRNK